MYCFIYEKLFKNIYVYRSGFLRKLFKQFLHCLSRLASHVIIVYLVYHWYVMGSTHYETPIFIFLVFCPVLPHSNKYPSHCRDLEHARQMQFLNLTDECSDRCNSEGKNRYPCQLHYLSQLEWHIILERKIEGIFLLRPMRERKERYDNIIGHHSLQRKYNRKSCVEHILGVSYETEQYP